MKDSNREYLQGVIDRVALANPPPDDMNAEAFAAALPMLIQKIDEAVADDIRNGRAPLDIADDLAELLAALDEARTMVTGSVAEQLDASRTVVLKRLSTEIDPDKVRRKRDPGRCFIRAGWTVRGWTAGGHGRAKLLVLDAPGERERVALAGERDASPPPRGDRDTSRRARARPDASRPAADPRDGCEVQR